MMKDIPSNAGRLACTLLLVAMLVPLAACSSAGTSASADSSSSQGDGTQETTSDQSTDSAQGDSSAGTSADQGSTPPDAPSGDSQGASGGSTPPDMPSGDSQGGQGGTAQSDGQGGTAPSGTTTGGGTGGGANTTTFDYSGTYAAALTADGTAQQSGEETYTATGADENVALAENGGTLTASGDTLTKSGDDSDGDNCNFYGLNSIALAVGTDSRAYLTDCILTASSEGSNGIFATNGATVYASGDTIATTAGNSRGLDATYNGTIIADSVAIDTQGDHCASVATDRGGGSISVTNSTLRTAGSGSPILYSTGDIEVDNVDGEATGSQIAGMEGLNTILILDSSLTSENTDKTASDPVADAVIIYQSTSGDAESTTGEAASFQAIDSDLSSAISSGAFFYLTNTQANIVLSGTTLDYDSDSADLLMVAGNDSNSWGSAGSNGATASFTAYDEVLNGNIEVDSISALDAYLLDGTTYTGTTSLIDNSAASDSSAATLAMTVSADSTWIVTGDSTVSSLSVESGGKVIDSSGKTVNIVANGQTVVSGDSSLTVTVTGDYSTTADTTSAGKVSTSYIDRSGFDSYYGSQTTFGTNAQTERAEAVDTSQTDEGTSSAQTDTQTGDDQSGTTADQGNWWTRLWHGFLSLFGL